MSDLPRGWAETTIGHIFAVVGGGTPDTKLDAYWAGSTPWISSADISDRGVISVRRRITSDAINGSATSCVPADSIIVVTRVGLGKVARASEPITFSQDCQALLPVSGIDSEFLRLQMSKTAQSLRYQSRGTTISGVTRKQLLDLPLLIPPTAEQERIVAAIEEQFSRLDAGVAALERVRQNLKRMRRAALQRTVPDNPRSSWTKARIDETVRIVDYRGRTPPFSSRGVPHLRSFNVKNGQVDWTGCTYVSNETYDKYMSRGFPAAGDLLFTTEAPMGEVAFAPTTKFCMAQRMMLLKPDARLWVSEYLMYHLWSPWFQEHLRIHATGTTVQGISSRNFRPLQLWMPQLDEQKRLATEVRQELALVASTEQSFAGQSKRTVRLRSAILAAAFSGKLVPQDPSDEAASFLLGRIAAERASSNGHKTTNARKPRASRSKVPA